MACLCRSHGLFASCRQPRCLLSTRSQQTGCCIYAERSHDIPSYPNLPFKLICMLHNVTLHVYNQVDAETDAVYAQMTLQPINKEALLISDMGLKQNRQPSNLRKTPTAVDTNPHGGFSVPRRAAEKIFHPSISQCNLPLRLWSLEICMTSLGLSDIFIEVTDISFPPVPSFITSSNTTLSAQKASTDDKVEHFCQL
ncbi:auxin response factor 19 [Tanacetum coccineum]